MWGAPAAEGDHVHGEGAISLAKETLGLLESVLTARGSVLPGIITSARISTVFTTVVVGCSDNLIRMGCCAGVALFLVKRLVHSAEDFEWLPKVLHMLLHTKLPFWSIGPIRQGATTNAGHSLEYFRLVGKIVHYMAAADPGILPTRIPDLDQRIETECEWIVDSCVDETGSSDWFLFSGRLLAGAAHGALNIAEGLARRRHGRVSWFA